MSSPPHYRHDGTSPLPLGMDASPPPVQWKGRGSVWPHDPRGGWSFCVMIPSWTTLPQAKTGGIDVNPAVFFRVQVGIQSPGGVSSMRGCLRRFSDFLKLHSALRRVLPRKRLPPPPPKNTLQRINASQALLEQRRAALEEWMKVLLTEISVSRSAPMAAFLELEAAARHAVMAAEEASLDSADASQQLSPGSLPALKIPPRPASRHPSLTQGIGSASYTGGSLRGDFFSPSFGFPPGGTSSGLSYVPGVDSSIASDDGYSSEYSAATSTALRQDSPVRLQEKDNRVSDSSTAGDGQFQEQQLTSFNATAVTPDGSRDQPGGTNEEPGLGEVKDEPEMDKTERGEAEQDQTRGGEVDHDERQKEKAEWSGEERSIGDLTVADELPAGIEAVLPEGQRAVVRKILGGLRSRLRAAGADMDALLTRLRHEMAVKDFLTSKVKDLEGELDSERRKGRQLLNDAIQSERDISTALQWELAEAKAALDNASDAAHLRQVAEAQKEELYRAAEVARSQLEEELQAAREEIQAAQQEKEMTDAQAKAKIKVLAKEVKGLRRNLQVAQDRAADAELAQGQLTVALNDERQAAARCLEARTVLLQEVEALRQRLKDCSLDNLLQEEGGQGASGGRAAKGPADASGQREEALDLLATSDNRIGLLLAEAQLMAEGGENLTPASSSANMALPNGSQGNGLGSILGGNKLAGRAPEGRQLEASDWQIRRMMSGILIDNVQLRRNINSLTRQALIVADNEDMRL